MSYETVMTALTAGLALSAASRVVQRGMVLDPAGIKDGDLTKGVLCVVAQGGGNFWNYQGREGEGGDLDVTVVGFVQVSDKAETMVLEQAEFSLIEDVLTFCKSIGIASTPIDAVVPIDWRQSGQLEHPFGWVTMKLKVRWL